MTKTMIGTCKKCGNAAAINAAHGRSGWPPKEIDQRFIHDLRYNLLYYMNNRVCNYQIFCWINNNIVKIVNVSNIHTGSSSDEHVLRNKQKEATNNQRV